MDEKPVLNISKETKKDVCGTLETFVETFGEGTFLNILDHKFYSYFLKNFLYQE